MTDEPSTIATVVERIYHAFDYLHVERGYKLEEIRIVTGGGTLVRDGVKITPMDDAELRQLKVSGVLGIEADRLHKNSILKIRDLRYTLAVRRYINRKLKKGKMHWEEASTERQRGDDRRKASMAWLWSPQIDTIQRLENLVTEAKKLGWPGPEPKNLPVQTLGDDDDVVESAARSGKRRRHADEQHLPA